MAVEVHVRKLEKSWQYDFKFPGRPRDRKGGFRTKQAAKIAGEKLLARLETGACVTTLTEAYNVYTAATNLKEGSRDSYENNWKRIAPVLGELFIEEIDSSTLDRFKQTLPLSWEPTTVNLALGLVKSTLRFMWKRGKLSHVPYVPMESVVVKHRDWYTLEERDALLEGMFRQYPRWYLFFYLTCRLGLRKGEVYGITHRQVRHIPPRLIIDHQLQQGTGKRAVKIITRKNNEAYTLELSQDVLDAIQWHIAQGYAGEEFLFSKTGKFPLRLDTHKHPLMRVQRALGLRLLSHHAIGRHSVASQAATGGESIKAIQAQLGHRSEKSTHRYAHLGSRAQLGVVTNLAPVLPPHAAGQK
jgi:integrase